MVNDDAVHENFFQRSQSKVCVHTNLIYHYGFQLPFKIRAQGYETVYEATERVLATLKNKFYEK
jgi:hypothetical protein